MLPGWSPLFLHRLVFRPIPSSALFHFTAIHFFNGLSQLGHKHELAFSVRARGTRHQSEQSRVLIKGCHLLLFELRNSGSRILDLFQQGIILLLKMAL